MACVNQSILKVQKKALFRSFHPMFRCHSFFSLAGKIYDLGGQVLAANSAPVIFNLAKEIGSELVELDTHKLALIDSSTGKYQDIKVADDYVSVISLTLELQVSFFYCAQNWIISLLLEQQLIKISPLFFDRIKQRIQVELGSMLLVILHQI